MLGVAVAGQMVLLLNTEGQVEAVAVMAPIMALTVPMGLMVEAEVAAAQVIAPARLAAEVTEATASLLSDTSTKHRRIIYGTFRKAR